jgi:hypothetical protein
MRRLPNHDEALISRDKLRYCLDPSHEIGRHKARVFASALGLDLSSIDVLDRMLREGIAAHDAYQQFTLIDGTQRWVVEWDVLGRLGPMRLITAWNRHRRGHPELVSCYLKRGKR